MRATLLCQQDRLTLQSGEHTGGLGAGVIRTEHKPSATLHTIHGVWLPGEGLHQQAREWVSQRILLPKPV